MSSPYSQFRRSQLTLRDELAVDRTVLANERTLLAYVRTALGFLVLGLTFQHFLEQVYYHLIGYAFMLFAGAILVLGTARFLSIRADLNLARQAAADAADGPPDPGQEDA